MNKADKSIKTADKAAGAKPFASKPVAGKPAAGKPTLHAIKGGKPAAKPAAKAAKPIPLKAAPPAADDAPVIALNLPMAKLSPAMAAYFKKCQDKLGFVPNVLVAYAFDMAKLETFVAMYNDLMLGESGLSKLEREMIAVAVSSQNRCYYCLTAHGAAVRQYSRDPLLGEHMVMNYRAARAEQTPARHARLRGQAHGLAVAAWKKATASGCAAPDFPTATSGTFRRSPASSTCRTASLPPPTCGRTRSITARRASVSRRRPRHAREAGDIKRTCAGFARLRVMSFYRIAAVFAAERRRSRAKSRRLRARPPFAPATPILARNGMVVAQEEPRRPHRRRDPRPRRQRGRCRGGGRLRARGHLSARRQSRRRRLHGDPSRQRQPRHVAIDYRETAPGAATPTMFLDAKGDPDPKKSRDSALAVGVPGTVAGLALAQQKYGSGKLIARRADRAGDPARAAGLPGRRRHRRLAAARAQSGWRAGRRRRRFSSTAASVLHEGDRLLQFDLADTLQAIAQDGPHAFYQGRIAERDRRRGARRRRHHDGGRSEELSRHRARRRCAAPIAATTSSPCRRLLRRRRI